MNHYCFDSGSQRFLADTYKQYQEVKADYFAYHFCIPTFMLERLKGVTANDVARIFNVEFDFAIRRLDMYKSNLITVAESCISYGWMAGYRRSIVKRLEQKQARCGSARKMDHRIRQPEEGDK